MVDPFRECAYAEKALNVYQRIQADSHLVGRNQRQDLQKSNEILGVDW